MNASVDQAHRLLGAQLRDPQQGCEGRIVGVDQTRETPALLVVWENQPQAQRAELTQHDLHELVLACVGPERLAQDKKRGANKEVAAPAVTWRRTAGS